jgi:hypothetical protein
MKHERPYAEDLSADNVSSSEDCGADSASTKVGDIHQDSALDTAWDNWKSVRDVG